MSDKKNNDYEKPESKGVGGDDLEDVSGGAGDNGCVTGEQAFKGYCQNGLDASFDCNTGNLASRYCTRGVKVTGGDCVSGDGVAG